MGHLGQFLWISLLFLATKGYSSPQKYHGVYLYEPSVEVTPQGVLVAFEKSCGAEFLGFVAKETKTKEGLVLEIGVALKHSAFLCTAGLETIVMKFPVLVSYKYSQIVELEVTKPTPLLLARVYQVGFGNGKLFGLAENRCGSFVGTLLRPLHQDQLESRIELGLVHLVPKKSQSTSCKPAPLIRPLINAMPTAVSQVIPWREKNPSISAVYSIHMKEIANLESGRYQYLLACNEAPIGIAESMGSPKQQKVVVARYYNRPCPEGLPLQQYQALSFSGLPLKPDRSFKGTTSTSDRVSSNSHSESTGGQATIRAVEDGWQIQPMVQGSPKRAVAGKTFKYWSSCAWMENHHFIVWSRDSKGRLSMGLLTFREESSREECRKGAYAFGRFKEIEVNNVDQEILPLRLRHI